MYKSEDIKRYKDKLEESKPLIKALKQGKLIIFVGAGMSVHLGVPSWRGFALKYLDYIYENKTSTLMNYKTKESLKNEGTREILSICKFISSQSIPRVKTEKVLKEWFEVKTDLVKEKGLYEKLYNLNAIYVTTNYDNALDLLAKQSIEDKFHTEDSNYDRKHVSIEQRGKVYYKIEEFNKDILSVGNIIHIHGSINEPSDMVVSSEDYIKRYGKNHVSKEQEIYSKFLTSIFENDYVILFIGYGLGELEILQYMFEEELGTKRGNIQNRYLVLPCYSDEYFKVSYLADYYKKHYNITTIPYDMTDIGYNELKNILDFLHKLKKDKYPNENSDEIMVGMRLIEEL